MIFSEKRSFSFFFGFLLEKLMQGCQNNTPRWQKNKWGKWFFTSNDLICDIIISHWTKLFGFWLKYLNKVVNTAIFASRFSTSEETFFFRINYQFQFILAFWGIRVWKFSESISGLSEMHLTCSESNFKEKMFFFGTVISLHICSDCDANTFESSAKEVFWVLQTAWYASNWKVRKKWLSF